MRYGNTDGWISLISIYLLREALQGYLGNPCVSWHKIGRVVHIGLKMRVVPSIIDLEKNAAVQSPNH